MTRSGLSPRLSAHLAEPFVEVNPEDAGRLDLCPADLVEINSSVGQGVFRIYITDAVAPGHVFAPIHWTGETAPSARVDAIVPSVTDPISGQPETKATAVSIRRMKAAWYGFAVSTKAISPPIEYWATARTEGGYRTELAGKHVVENWVSTARDWFGVPDATAISTEDPARGSFRIALKEGSRLVAALFVFAKPEALMRDYLATLPEVAPQLVLSGRAPLDSEDVGPTICSCFGVGLKSIIRAIQAERLVSVDEIGETIQAGTNCGSCRPELAELVSVHSPKLDKKSKCYQKA
jgi:assimilatory nitrate reductase catalytic subunit